MRTIKLNVTVAKPNATVIVGFVFAYPTRRGDLITPEWYKKTCCSDRSRSELWGLPTESEEGYVTLMIGNDEDDNWNDHPNWPEKVGIDTGLDDNYFPQKYPVEKIRGIEEGDTIEIVSPNKENILRLKVSQRMLKSWNEDFQDVVY